MQVQVQVQLQLQGSCFLVEYMGNGAYWMLGRLAKECKYKATNLDPFVSFSVGLQLCPLDVWFGNLLKWGWKFFATSDSSHLKDEGSLHFCSLELTKKPNW